MNISDTVGLIVITILLIIGIAWTMFLPAMGFLWLVGVL